MTVVAVVSVVVAVVLTGHGATARWTLVRSPVASTVTPLRTSWRLPLYLRFRGIRTRRADHDLAVHHALTALSRSLRSGDTLSVALGHVSVDHAVAAPVLEPVLRRHDRGEPLVDALSAAPLPDGGALALLHRTLTLICQPAIADHGRLRAIDAAASLALDRSALRAERRAHAAQAHLSAVVLTWVPLGVAGLSVLADPHVRATLVGTPLGWTCLGAGSALVLAGQRWIRHIVEDDR